MAKVTEDDGGGIIIIIIKSNKYVQDILPLFVGCNMTEGGGGSENPEF